MKQITFTMTAALSLMFFLLLLGTTIFVSDPGWVLRDGGGGIAGGSDRATLVLFKSDRGLGIGWTHSDIWFEGQIECPIWLLFLVTAIIPAWWMFLRIRHKHPAGLCPNYSYDLRAHEPGDNCPE